VCKLKSPSGALFRTFGGRAVLVKLKLIGSITTWGSQHPFLVGFGSGFEKRMIRYQLKAGFAAIGMMG
jgi:hypothetical protein